jgi:HlyD family secretion protein
MVAVAAVAAGCGDEKPDAAAAQPRTELKATVAPFDAVAVVAPIEGRIAEIRVNEGAAVRAGDVIATLSNPAVARDLVYARSAVARLQSRPPSAASVRRRPRQAETASLEIAQEIVDQKQRRLERMRRLFADRDVSRQEVENAELELTAARRDLNAERERQSLPIGAAPSSSPALVQAELERAQADLALAEHRQSLLEIRAPASGTIMRLRVGVGADVFTRDAVAEIVDSASARVQASVAPELLRFVRVGQAVDVNVLTIPARRFREPVARVIPPGTEAGAAIIVNVPNPDRMLQPGTPAIITIQ